VWARAGATIKDVHVWNSFGIVVAGRRHRHGVGPPATLIVLICYTVETYRLRQAAQRQTELPYMPIVVLELQSKRATPGQRMALEEPVLRNIGFGPAFDVQTDKVQGTDF
jgi:hypothetical protein